MKLNFFKYKKFDFIEDEHIRSESLEKAKLYVKSCYESTFGVVQIPTPTCSETQSASDEASPSLASSENDKTK